MKYILWFAGGFLSLLIIYFAAAFLFSWIEVKAEPAKGKEVRIYILSNGVHTDIVVPVKNRYNDWSRQITYSSTRKNDTSAKYLALGWGDRAFYLETPSWSDLKFSTAFNALFGLSRTALHCHFYHSMQAGADCKAIDISESQYRRLMAYISSSFEKDSCGRFRNIPNAHYDDNDAFFEAKGSYSLFQTCNTWANAGLKSCGQKAALWTPFDKGIFYHYEKE